MPFNPEAHHRCSVRLKDYDYSEAGSYYVTVCTHERECLLGDIVDGDMVLSGAGLMVRDVWEQLPNRYPNILLDAFVLMPNHIHSIIVLTDSPVRRAASCAPTLGAVIRAFKSLSAIRVNRLLARPSQPLWQRNYYEHVIRNERTLNAIREYIEANPSQWQNDQDNPDVICLTPATQ